MHKEEWQGNYLLLMERREASNTNEKTGAEDIHKTNGVIEQLRNSKRIQVWLRLCVFMFICVCVCIGKNQVIHIL